MAKIETNAAKVLQKARNDYRRRGKRLRQLKKPHARLSVLLDQFVQANFRSEGGKFGGWKPFKIGGRWVRKGGVRKAKRQKGKGKLQFDASAKLLRDTGRLSVSFIPFSTIRVAGIGSKIPYAEYHEKGKGVPKRPMLPEGRHILKMAKKIYNKHIKESFKKK